MLILCVCVCIVYYKYSVHNIIFNVFFSSVVVFLSVYKYARITRAAESPHSANGYSFFSVVVLLKNIMEHEINNSIIILLHNFVYIFIRCFSFFSSPFAHFALVVQFFDVSCFFSLSLFFHNR